MHHDDPRDPLEGKGEEMIPDRGIPFDEVGEAGSREDSPQPESEAPLPPERESAPSAANVSPLNTPNANLFAEEEELFEMAEEARPLEATSVGDLLEDGEGFPSENEPMLAKPPADYPDGGMRTAVEDLEMAGDIPPELEDGGMSAGYPPVRDDDLAPTDSPLVEPDPALLEGIQGLSAASFRDPSPVADLEFDRDLVTDGEDAPAHPAMVELLISDQEIKELWSRIDGAQRGVLEHISTLKIAQPLLDYIQEARDELLNGPENYEKAERYLNEVEVRIAMSRRLKELSRWYTVGLYLYELLWAVALLFVLLQSIGLSTAFSSSDVGEGFVPTYFLGSMIWGGFGGVVGALIALIKHIAIRQDFDTQHTWWYLSSPAMGLGFGAVVYLFMQVGLYAVIGAGGTIASPVVIYAVSWLAGYQHNVFSDLVKRMLKTLMGEPKPSKEAEKLPSEEGVRPAG